MKNDKFVCGAYIPPNNTTHNINIETDYFEKRSKFLYKCKDERNILIIGEC